MSERGRESVKGRGGERERELGREKSVDWLKTNERMCGAKEFACGNVCE